MRDGDLGLNAAGCGEELERHECGEDESAEVHTSKNPLSKTSVSTLEKLQRRA